ncbi:DEAD-box ATP-dependent RNA helicase 9 [Apostasia shenzhenica]|uniref:DNA 3'-5' helicase n=1 Tax=Apostasia shenzhenica TaxID=1088818 RepID=A0A2I0AI35_9ASPA|nr:DEAD-box ATP-dependent RNA helicase 9 [Apostasia shenzhenica]
MAELGSFISANYKGLCGVRLALVVPFGGKNGYQYTFPFRIYQFLRYKFLNRRFQYNHISRQKLSEEEDGFSSANMSGRSELLNKVSPLLGYSNIEDFYYPDRVNKEFTDMNVMKEKIDPELACTTFRCIEFGDSSPIELYGDVPLNELSLLLSETCIRHICDPASRKLVGEANGTISDEHIDACYFYKPRIANVSSFSEPVSSSIPHETKTVHADGGSDLNKDFSREIYHMNMNSKCLNTEVPLESILDYSVRFIPHTTSKKCHQLEEGGFHTVRKLLHHFPRTYADPQHSPEEIQDGCYMMFVGSVLSSRAIKAGSILSFLEVIVSCKLSANHSTSERVTYLHLKKFFRGVRFTSQPFLRSVQSSYKLGALVYICGKVRKMSSEDHFEMREYNIGMLEEKEGSPEVVRRPYPIYPSKAGLKPGFLMDTISRALKILPRDIDPIPNDILEEFHLPNLLDAFVGIHCPKSLQEADLARRRLNFDEFFYMQLARLFQMIEPLSTPIEKEELLCKYKSNRLNVIPLEEWSNLTKSLLNVLPYSLTPSQLSAVSEIIWDLRQPIPMNRLLQGDVGCGKTVVAFLACMEVIALGFQAALMVPTELVAVQHYERLMSLLENVEADQHRPYVALLTGSTASKQSKLILQGLRDGDVSMVIGTHSLIADKVEFSALRIAVIDEQHRFGVIQRGRFNSKLYSASPTFRTSQATMDDPRRDEVYMAPHVLTMSATPIPRTMALALYGDMSLTQITDLPPGRTPVETFAFEGNEASFRIVFQMMHDELISRGKVYLVYPVIEESEQLPQLHAVTADFESIANKFQSYNCGLLHGRMKSEEKDEELKKFRYGETQILLATQVIEIGVDIPDASMMVVMNAERFGIAQLHQLRGRVGRGARKSKCVFLSSTSSALSRLKILEEKSSNGFNLAMADLLIRGPGNLLGKKQSGHLPDFPIARLELDGNILQEAHLAALVIAVT